MAEYDDGAYYEVQLNNKQLVFFFMAALAIAVVVFLCGVMVGRGVHDATLAASQNDIAAGALRQAPEPRPKSDVDTASLDYTSRLEQDGQDATLTPAPSVSSTSPETAMARSPRRAEPASVERAAPPEPEAQPGPQTPPPRTAAAAAPLGRSAGAFTIQVVALKTGDAARSLLGRLQQKNYRAYLEDGGEAGLHRVRVGRFATREEAELVARKLRDEEKFKPYITQ